MSLGTWLSLTFFFLTHFIHATRRLWYTYYHTVSLIFPSRSITLFPVPPIPSIRTKNKHRAKGTRIKTRIRNSQSPLFTSISYSRYPITVKFHSSFLPVSPTSYPVTPCPHPSSDSHPFDFVSNFFSFPPPLLQTHFTRQSLLLSPPYNITAISKTN